MSIFPTELIEHIIKFVWSSNDIKTLNSCALASSHLLPIIRFYRYSSISIICDLDVVPLQKFACLLKASPCVAGYVQSFSFIDCNPWIYDDDYNIPYPGPWRLVDSDDGGLGDLPTVLRALTRLKYIRLQSKTRQSYPVFSDPLKQALMSTFSLPTLQTVHLKSLQAIPAVLFSSTHIRSLHVAKCTFDLPYSPDVVVWPAIQPSHSQAETRNACIEDLKLKGASYPREDLGSALIFLLHPNCPLSLTSLKHFHVQMFGGMESPRIMEVIDKCRGSLESFNFIVYEYCWSDSLKHISLSGLTNLKHLTLSTKVFTLEKWTMLSAEDRLFPGPIIQIAACLSTLPGLSPSSSSVSSTSSVSKLRCTCPLESLSIGLVNGCQSARIPKIREGTPAEEVQNINTRIRAWERLDDVLTSLVTTNGATGPVVKIHCAKEIVVKQLKTRCLRRCFETGRVEVIIERLEE
ncbi:hypothetical protein AX16_010721 [Volvariella volvacea WC 439]|nr:hypothetical protein AX16_010721 [Volvariella volvacea WC 439]